MKNKIKSFLIKYPTIYAIAKNINFILIKLINYLRLSISTIFFAVPVKNNKIVFCNYFGNGYGDNGKYIAEEIIKQELNYDIVWLLKKNLIGEMAFPPQVRVVKYGSFKGLYELATAKVWIDNCRKVFYPFKREEQFYIQTWHGGLGIKKIEGDVEESLSKVYIKNAKKDSKMADLFISNSAHLTNIYKRAFWYTGEIYECGYPKNDIFFNYNKDVVSKVRQDLNIEENIKIILYAPTFRLNNEMKHYDIDFKLLLDTLDKKTGEQWAVIIRLHPNLIGLDSNFEYNKYIIDATPYPDMQELVIACDALISDYSSCMFDAEMLKKPTFIYASDIEEYMGDRGFYFALEELPFPLATNNEKLITNINNFDIKRYKNDVDEFNKRVGLKEYGNASKKIIERINAVC